MSHPTAAAVNAENILRDLLSLGPDVNLNFETSCRCADATVETAKALRILARKTFMAARGLNGNPRMPRVEGAAETIWGACKYDAACRATRTFR